MIKKNLLNKVLIISLLLFITALSVFVYSLFIKPEPTVGLNLNLKGPNEVNSLENYSYNLEIENTSNQLLTNINLKINLSSGVFFTEKNIDEKESYLFLDTLQPYQKYEQKIDIFFINEGQLRENIQLTINYKIKDKPHIFEKEENFSIFVRNSAIKTQIYLPEKTYINQPFESSFRIFNLTKQKLNNLTVTIEPPTEFKFISSFPQTENFYWQFSSINPSETKNISLIGQIQKINSSGIFNVKVSFDFKENSYSLVKEIAKVNLLENPVNFEIKAMPETESIPIGSNIFYEVSLENKSQTVLENNEVRIYFDELFDLSSIRTDGYLSKISKTLFWNSRSKPELLKLKPKDKVKFYFSASLYQSYPILGEKNKDFSAKIKVEFKSPTIPIELETEKKDYTLFQEDEKKIMGKISLEQQVFYNDNFFKGTGPFPLESEQSTTLSWQIKIKTIGEDFENFTISTKFPETVNLTGKVAGDVILDNLKFDPKTGIFIYSLNKLPANLGYTEKELELIFQLKVNPGANTDFISFVIIPELQYSAKGSFSNTQISSNLRELNSYEVIK